MKKIECKNPKVSELKKGDGRRHINASSFKKIIKDGLNYCAWCGENRVSGKRKYCNNHCRDNCYTFIYPQSELGLEYHLEEQDFKCADCQFDYMPFVEKTGNINGIRKYKKNDIPNERLFKRLKTMVFKINRPEVDHVIPIALGGDPVGFDNHQILCYSCHKKKTKNDVGMIATMKRELK